MTSEERQVMESYVRELEGIADKAEQLQKRVDPAYAKILQTEVVTYRQLIAIWKHRLSSEQSPPPA